MTDRSIVVVEEEEEVLVIAHIPGLEEVLGSETKNLVLEIEEHGQSLNAVLNDNLLLKGNFEISLGTQLLFEESGSSNMKSVKCIGTSITNVPLELKSTKDIDQLNNIISNPFKNETATSGGGSS